MNEKTLFVVICNPSGSHFIEYDDEIEPDMFIIKNPIDGINKLNHLLYTEVVDRMIKFESIEDEEGDPLLNFERYLHWISRKKIPQKVQIPKIVVIIDNFDTLMKESSGEIGEVINRLKELGPSAGISVTIFS